MRERDAHLEFLRKKHEDSRWDLLKKNNKKKKKEVIFESWKGLEWETESLNKSLSWNMSLNTKGRWKE